MLRELRVICTNCLAPLSFIASAFKDIGQFKDTLRETKCLYCNILLIDKNDDYNFKFPTESREEKIARVTKEIDSEMNKFLGVN